MTAMTEPRWPDPFARSSIRALGEDLRSGHMSAVDLADECLARTAASAGTIGAFVELDERRTRAEARDSARRLREGRPRSALEGIPYAVKDIIAVADTLMRAGSRAIERRSVRDASLVSALTRAGAVLLGRTRLHEIAFGATGLNAFDGGAHNPLDPSRIPGGSSSGSAAAVAGHLAGFALGTDTGGSCRIPAACCGVVGFKPTFGLLDVEGVLPLAPTLDHLGVLAMSAEDAWLIVATCAGLDLTLPPPADPVRAGVLRRSSADLDPAVTASFEGALVVLARLGWDLVDIGPFDLEEVANTTATIMFYEAFRVHEDAMRSSPERFGADVLDRLRQGAATGDQAYRRALGERDRLLAVASRLFADFDVLLSPTLPIVPPTVEEAGRIARHLPLHTRVFNLLGVPAVSIPLPTAPPVSLQIAGPAGSDDRVLALADAAQEAL